MKFKVEIYAYDSRPASVVGVSHQRFTLLKEFEQDFVLTDPSAGLPSINDAAAILRGEYPGVDYYFEGADGDCDHVCYFFGSRAVTFRQV